jgi:hypothetical protein
MTAALTLAGPMRIAVAVAVQEAPAVIRVQMRAAMVAPV